MHNKVKALTGNVRYTSDSSEFDTRPASEDREVLLVSEEW